MCGIAGFFRPAGLGTAAEEILARLAGTLAHRGPDDSGVWCDPPAGIALGHRRLAVLDLSAAGRQPMISVSGRFVIVFNGEIYNHLEIRGLITQSQPTHAWRGNSDTETLLAGLDCWGLEPTLVRTEGMFAFALWDRERRTLTLARDRLGEKPLYYGWQGDAFLFGSELKALRMHPAFNADIDRNVIRRYLQYGYIGAPYSIYRNIRKLTPGAYLQLAAGCVPNALPDPRSYWSVHEVVARGAAQPFEGDDHEAAEQLEVELKRAVALQSVADVPVGAFLSGGTDSSTIAALMQAQSNRPVRTFTVGFHESAFQEAGYARSVAQLLGTEHNELYVTAREAMEVIPELPSLYDEPFGDSSAIATLVVSRFARRHVTVCLSGDGGDELFGGYTRYRSTADTWRVLRRIPHAARRALAWGSRAYARRRTAYMSGWRAERLAVYLGAGSAAECYMARVLQCRDPEAWVLGVEPASEPDGAVDTHHEASADETVYDMMMCTDTLTYLPDDILTKVDRASMGVSLEVRVPMLDHRVLELAWRLPVRMKVRQGRGKWLLRRVLERYIPETLVERPKMGFGVPVGEWLRGPLREWAEEQLSETRLRQEGFLSVARVREKWLRHLNRASREDDSLWQLLMFQSWLADVGRHRSMGGS